MAGNIQNIHNINGKLYIPIPQIGEHSPYSYSRVRGLISENKIPKEKLLKICNLTFILFDYIPTLKLMSEDPEKYKKQKFMVDQYYEEKSKKNINNSQQVLTTK